MVVDSYARSAQASRIVQARLPICAAIVLSSLSLWRDLGTPCESRWQPLEFQTPDTREWTLSQAI
jgi:hypothetical protein